MTLAEALRPLHESYLRRLDEMVGRLPQGQALTEQTARTDGRLALDDLGLPLRFDVVDARDGHAYEVHGAHPDAPLAESAAVSGLEIKLGPGNWEELPVTCAFAAAASPDDSSALADLLRAFAVFGGWGGLSIEGGSWSGRVHGARIESATALEVRAVFDLGTCAPPAVEALCRALAAFSRDRAELSFVRVGG